MKPRAPSPVTISSFPCQRERLLVTALAPGCRNPGLASGSSDAANRSIPRNTGNNKSAFPRGCLMTDALQDSGGAP
ncbi:hypothetical protein P7K49_006033, partial [Saguinus oedipus]